jgi:hypothetical protein
MKYKLNIKRLVFGALFGALALIVASTVGCTTPRRATNADAAHAPVLNATQTCRANLHHIEGAKRVWALENRKMDTTVPTDADLFGPDALMREKPKCPSGGTYTLRAVEDAPLCSIPGHVY